MNLNGISRVVLPPMVSKRERETRYGVVQLMVNGDDGNTVPFLRFGLSHGQIVGDFLREIGIRYEHEVVPDGGRETIPEKKGDNYEVVGAGRVNFLPFNKRVNFLDERSYYYGMGINESHLVSLRGDVPFGWELCP